MNFAKALIAALFEELESDEPGKSTECLFQMTVDKTLIQFNMEIDAGDVADALLAAPDSVYSEAIKEAKK